MNPLEDNERKIIIEFCHLLEKSKQLFNGLRELPQYGHKQWSLYFGRTFDIYTRLWKYQQTHRTILDTKYGMKRWQIGEIASKIGQLYYHFYLRTSETAYLNEAFSFYYAIRGRCYYTKANKEDKCELMVKKLRYYARFIVVCLLLNKMKLVKELIKELERQIIEYGNTYDPDDQVEWTVVVDEVKAFIHAEPIVSVVNTDNQTMILSHRLSPMVTPPVERSPQMNLSLQEILIVGSSSQQVKFSELTMDMFRMLQTLEREPSGDIQHIFDESPRQRFMSTPSAPCQEGVEPGQKASNPHKYLLFKPSPCQMLVYLSSACNDLPPNGALLLYISADGFVTQNNKHTDEGTWGYDLGGLITTSKNDIFRECSKDPKASTSTKFKELQCFYPGDLYPYTRRPLFVVVDSDNSYAFQNMPRHFGQPLVILMSPLDLPPSFHDPRRQGSLFTLFLHSPLEGLCYCCDLSSVTVALWDRAQMLLDTFMAEASSILVRSRIDPTFLSFIGDDFLRLLLLRFVFCEAVLRMHRLFRGRTHRPRCSPPMPEDLFDHPTLVHIILDIANVLQIRNHIQDPSATTAVAGPN
ncbi:protein SCAI [Ostrinia nubilalis]|uniref:protein SCAI n=1 Tax=Ostrinia nubilalis TaxID=29057 RepID=UPI0030824DFD